METNEIQIGGDHYLQDYQHWDFVIDTGMHYLLGCATKYVARWRRKNGVEDLRKSLHYIAKAQDVGITFPTCTMNTYYIQKFTSNMCHEDARVVRMICTTHYDRARDLIQRLIEPLD